MSGFTPGLVDGCEARRHHGTRWIHTLPDSIVVFPMKRADKDDNVHIYPEECIFNCLHYAGRLLTIIYFEKVKNQNNTYCPFIFFAALQTTLGRSPSVRPSVRTPFPSGKRNIQISWGCAAASRLPQFIYAFLIVFFFFPLPFSKTLIPWGTTIPSPTERLVVCNASKRLSLTSCQVFLC